MKNFIQLLPVLLVSLGIAQRAGDRLPVAGVNPTYVLDVIRPPAISWAVGGMDFMSDGRMVVTSWRDPYGVFIISNAIVGSNPVTATVTEFATGLSEALGLKVVNDSIYVLQKDELTLLLDQDGDGRADEYRTIAYDWTKSVNEKEYAIGLEFDGTYFYAVFGDPTVNSGTSISPQPAGRQNGTLRIRKSDGFVEPFTGGMRVPGGTGQAFGEIWVTESQGGFRVSHVLYNARMGRYYGRPVNPPSMFQTQPFAINPYNNDPNQTIYTPFAVNIPFGNPQNNGIMRSPGNPLAVTTGPFAGQFLIPDCDNAYGGMVRAFVERMPNGEYQGAAFQFARGFEGVGVFHVMLGPDGNLYTGGNGSSGAGWGRTGNVGMNRMRLSGSTSFDMLAVRNTGANTFEIDFTKPLNASLGNNVTAHLFVRKWWDRISDTYGCCREPGASATAVGTALTVTSAIVSANRRTVTVTFPAGELELRWIHYFRWANGLISDASEMLWAAETWYTLNTFGPGTAPVPVEKPALRGKQPFDMARTAAGDLRVQARMAGNGDVQVSISDLRGKISVRRNGYGSNPVFFSRNELPEGMYIVHIQAGNTRQSRLGVR